MALNLTPESLALLVCGQIHADVKAGVLPSGIDSFAQLHDFVDANEYILTALEAAEVEFDPSSEAQADLTNAAMDKVSTWLRNRK